MKTGELNKIQRLAMVKAEDSILQLVEDVRNGFDPTQSDLQGIIEAITLQLVRAVCLQDVYICTWCKDGNHIECESDMCQCTH